jgi:predicted ATP-dependent endonuclease of OLD family
LHPAIQRSFLKFISKTNNQYFISTHSNSYLDFEVEGKEVYSTKLENGQTKIKKCNKIEEISDILGDLGIRASEIIQSNGIIWVEGPSDRIYIKKWIEFCDPSLTEGFHFTFQFYGGSILKHYSAEDEEFKEYINLLFINKNSFVVMDSDMDKEYHEADLSSTKQRIISELRGKNLGFWVTAGREVENYLSDNNLTVICKEAINRSQFGKIEEYCNKFHDKVKFAKKSIEAMTEDQLNSNYDLKERILDLCERIKSWNS